MNTNQIAPKLVALEESVGMCVNGGNIGGVPCAAIRAGAKIITELLK